MTYSDPDAPRSPNYPYRPFTVDAPIGWIELPDIAGPAGATAWVPAQRFHVGYTVDHRRGEPWLASAVSTGTAVHTTYGKAVHASLYELVQIDAAMGHWYGQSKAYLVQPDDRTARLTTILDRHIPQGASGRREFHYLPNADLGDFTIACVIIEEGGRIPAVSVGLGADRTLEGAMYKAWLEGVGVRSLAEYLVVGQKLDGLPFPDDPTEMLDLDTNVLFSALPEHAGPVLDRFGRSLRPLH